MIKMSLTYMFPFKREGSSTKIKNHFAPKKEKGTAINADTIAAA